MSSATAVNTSLAVNGGAGVRRVEALPPRGSPGPSLSMSLGRSSLNLSASSPASATAAALTSQLSFTLRSSGRPASTSQLQQAYNRRHSLRGGSRGQGRVAGRISPPPPFPNFVKPSDGGAAAPAPAGLSSSTATGRAGGRAAPQTPLGRHGHPSNRRERAADGTRPATSPGQQQQQRHQQGKSTQQEPREEEGVVAQGQEEHVPPLYTPYTLKTRGEVEDIYTMCFLTTLEEENLDNELASSFRASMAKVASPFSSTRKEGLREALQQIRSIGMCAAAEALQGQADTCAAPCAGKAKPKPASSGPNSKPTGSQQQQHPSRGRDANLLPPQAEAFLTPFDGIRATMAGVDAKWGEGASGHAAYTSETWERAQRALRGSDFTSAIFRRVLAPRSEVRAAMNMGGPVNVELSSEDALTWSSRRPPVEISPLEKLKRESKRAMMAKVGMDRQQQLEQQFRPPASPVQNPTTSPEGVGRERRMTPCGFEVVVPEKPIYALLTEITYEEQELALRLLQGFCLTINYQRRCIAESCFFHYATEVFQCLLQRVEAVFTQRRLLQLSHTTGTATTPASLLRNGVASSSDKASVYVSTPIAPGSGSFSPPSTANTAAGAGTGMNPQGVARSAPAAVRHTDPAQTTTPVEAGPLDVEEEQVAVVVALIDAVEAACHYSPTCLTRLVQTGGVVAMLNLVYSPCVPESIREAVLDTISVLMQEVAPFRRAVASPSAVFPDSQQQQQQQQPTNLSGANGDAAVEDALLTTMLEQARTGSYNYPGAQQSGDPPPFMMDRASASKFDSAVREWFSKHGLIHAAAGAMELRNLKDWHRLRHTQQQQRLAAAGIAGGGGGGGDGGIGGGGGGGIGPMPSGGGVSIETTRDSKRATQLRASNIVALLQVIDGQRADLH